MARPAPTPTRNKLLDALVGRPGATAVELADAAGIGRSTAGKLLAKLAGEGLVARQSGGRQGGRRSPDRWTLLASAPATSARDPAPSSTALPDPHGEAADGGRLGAGELRRLVLGYLADRPGRALSPTAIAKALGHSPGAVANALGVLASHGAVAQAQVKPRRYAITQDRDPAADAAP